MLNQNPKFHATSTDILPGLVAAAAQTCSASLEVKGMLINDREKTTERILSMLRGIIDGWFSDAQDKVVFDKSRAWGSHSLMLRQLFPDARFIVMVRDLRAIYASIEKQHRKEPIFDMASSARQKTIYDRADKMFGVEGLVGGPMLGVEDLLRRDLPSTIYVRYEVFAQNPGRIIEQLYQNLDEELFEHDFDNVKNTSTDCDELYLNKYPHVGAGKIEPPPADEWKKFVSADLAATIMGRFAAYNTAFDYR